MFQQRTVIRSGEQENSLPHGLSRLLTLHKKGNPQLCKNCRTISLKQSHAESHLEWAFTPSQRNHYWRTGRGKCRKKRNRRDLQPQNPVRKVTPTSKNSVPYHIDFNKALDRVWHAALWATMRMYNFKTNLVHTIEQFYDKATRQYSSSEQLCERMVQNNSWNKSRIPSLAHPLQHLS